MKTKKALCILILLCYSCLMSSASGAEEEQRVIEAYDIGGIHLSIDASVFDNGSSTARTYIAQPVEYEPEKLIGYFWGASNAESILSSKVVADRHFKKDGISLYSERYFYDGAMLSVDFHAGTMSYRSRALEEWGYKDVCEAETSGCTESLDAQFVEDLASVLHEGLQLAPIYSCSVQEKKTNGDTFSYNVYDFAVIMDGIYCENQPYMTALSAEDLSIPAQYVQIWTNEEGLLMLTASLYDVRSTEEYETVSPCQNAVDCLCEELSWYIASDTVNIQSIVLEYVMTPIRGSTLSFRYVPAWKFQTGKRVWMPYNEMEGSCYRFNAITGELIE